MRVRLPTRLLGPRALYCACLAAALALGLSLRGSALEATLLADDFDHYAMRAGIYPLSRGPLDLFDFVGGEAHERRALLESGRLPWWSTPDIELSALRPLASALVTFDYDVLGGVPLRLHLHSMLWWALLLCGVAALLRALLPLPIACAALLLYAVDTAHGLPLGWIANRSALVAVGLVVWGLWAHVVYRTRGLRGGPLLSLVLVALGLAAGEHAIAPLGYFVAFELIGKRGALARYERLRALGGVAALLGAYLVLHAALGYGLSGSGFYIDPLASPVRYLYACAERVPLLVGDVLLGVLAEWHFSGPSFAPRMIDWGVPERLFQPANWQPLQLGLGVLALLLFAALAVWLQRSPAVERAGAAAARFLLAGAALSILPVCSTLPMSRLTLAAALGVDAALAVGLCCALGALRGRTAAHTGAIARRVLSAVAVLAIVAVHGVHAAVRSRDEAAYYAERSRLEENWVLRAEIADATVTDQHVFVVAAFDWTTQWALPFVRHRAGRPMPKSAHLLSGALVDGHVLTRSGDRMLDVEVRGGPPRVGFLGSVYRARDAPFHGRERVTLPAFDVTVLRAAEGQPVRWRMRFARPLEDPSYLFLHSTPDGLRRLALPGVGRRIELPPPALPRPARLPRARVSSPPRLRRSPPRFRLREHGVRRKRR